MGLSVILPIVQVVFSALLVASILLQKRGTGLGSAFGWEGNVFATRRGVERILFLLTIIFAVLFFASAIAQFIVR